MNKWKSRKLWVALWAMGLITAIVIMNRTDFTGLATLLATIPLAYIGVNGYQKTHLQNDTTLADNKEMK